MVSKFADKDLESKVQYYDSLPYTFVIERRDDQGTYYVARVIELPDLFMVGKTSAEAIVELESVKKEWIKTYLELGNKMPEPLKLRNYKGQYLIRMQPSLHEALAFRAQLEGVSINQYMVSALARTIGRDEANKVKV